MSQRHGRRSVVRVTALTLTYAALVTTCLGHAYRSEVAAGGPRKSPLPLRAAVLGGDEQSGRPSAGERDAVRSASWARAGALLASVAYLLGMGCVAGPAPVRLVCGNALVFLGLLLSLELGTRALGMHFPGIIRRGPTERDLFVYDRTKGWFHVPHGTGIIDLGGPDRGSIRINSLGLRGGEVSRAKPPGVSRVLVTGDSYVFGVGVDESNLMTSHLERLLNASGGSRWEVLNLGVRGYSTDQEYLLFEELGLRLGPDIVVLVMCDNDFDWNVVDFVYRRYYKPYFEMGADGRLILRNSPVPILSPVQNVKLWLGQESNVWNMVRSRSSDVPLVASFLGLFQVATPRQTAPDSLELTAALVVAFARRVEAAGAQLFVINTAHRGERTPLFQALRPKLRRERIRLLGLEETLGDARREAPDKAWDFGTDAHWNRDAHELVARVVHHYLRQAGMIRE